MEGDVVESGCFRWEFYVSSRFDIQKKYGKIGKHIAVGLCLFNCDGAGFTYFYTAFTTQAFFSVYRN